MPPRWIRQELDTSCQLLCYHRLWWLDISKFGRCLHRGTNWGGKSLRRVAFLDCYVIHIKLPCLQAQRVWGSEHGFVHVNLRGVAKWWRNILNVVSGLLISSEDLNNEPELHNCYSSRQVDLLLSGQCWEWRRWTIMKERNRNREGIKKQRGNAKIET